MFLKKNWQKYVNEINNKPIYMNNWGNINKWYHSFISEWTTKDSIQNFIYVFRSWCQNNKALTLEQAKCKQVFPSLSVNERSAFCSNNNSVKDKYALNTSSIKRRKSSTPLNLKKKSIPVPLRWTLLMKRHCPPSFFYIAVIPTTPITTANLFKRVQSISLLRSRL